MGTCGTQGEFLADSRKWQESGAHLFSVCAKNPGSSAGKESACNAGDPGWIPGSGRSPGAGNGNPLQYSCLEDPHEQRSLAGYSWGLKRPQHD